MESLIPIINELQDVLNTIREGSGYSKSVNNLINDIALDLPEIAVVGSQSVGKSSLLEYIIGRHFLPRGQGIVTRRPLILQLQQIRNENKEDYAEFGHKKGTKFTDFEKVREEIQIETNRLIGENKKVSENPILLRIYSKKSINLTLVDLPGLTKVPIEDQPSDIDIQIRKIVLSYIKRPSCLILAITAANTDIANSDSLNIAREVDPEGMRTIGVLSKLDTVDDYRTTLQVLNNRSYPLNRGYIAVMCKDSKQRTSGIKSLRTSLNEEKAFFENNIHLKSILNRCGTYNLVSILQKEFINHIIKLLPQLKNQSKKLIEHKQIELINYGDYSRSDILDNIDGIDIFTNKLLFLGDKISDNSEIIKNKGAVILNCFSKFSRKFQDMIDGQTSYQTGLMKLSGGARLNYIFHNWFGNTLFNFDPLNGLSDNEIRTAIKNSTGTKSSLFVSESAFEVLARIQIKKLLRPSLACVEQVYDELRKLVEQCTLPELIRYNNLKTNVINVVNSVLEECLQPTNKAIIDLINMELAYINTNHPDFIGGTTALTSIFEKDKSYYDMNLNIYEKKNSLFINNNLNNQTNSNTPIKKNHLILDDFLNYPNEEKYNNSMNSSKNENLIENQNYSYNNKNNENYSNPLFVNISKTSKYSNINVSTPTNNINNIQKNSPNSNNINSFNYKNSYKKETLSFNSDYNDFPMSKIGLPVVPDTLTTSEDPSEREKIESDIIKFFIVSYFNIVRKNIADSVPKAIMYFMVNSAKDAIQRELVTKLYKEDIFDELLQEEKLIIEKRQQCYKSINKFKNITKQLESLISNFNISSL